MENKIEHVIEHVEDEKVFCYTFDSLVRELSKKMVVNEGRLLSGDGEVTIGGHESIFNWIKAIDFEEGKTPAIEATFSSDGGKKTVRLDTEKLTPVGSLEEKASKEDLLYAMALTEAKMKVVSAIAEEVYPAVAFQISDYRKDMGKMRDEILENKNQASSFNEVMHSALSRKNVVSAVVIASMLVSSTGCVVATGTAKPIESTTNPAMTETFIPPTETATENPTAAAVTEIPNATTTETQILTETATEMPIITLTPESTVTLTPEPTEVATLPIETESKEDKNKEEIVKNINEFLASEGRFTFEEIKKNSQYIFGDSDLEKGVLPLGMIDGSTGQFILLGSNYDGDKKYMHFFLGATDVNNNRVVFDYNFRRTFMGLYDELPVNLVIKESSSVSYMGTKIDENMKKLSGKDEWNDFIEENTFKPISISWEMYSKEEQIKKFHLDKYGEILRFAKSYDLGIDYRIAIFYRLGMYELALTALDLPLRLDSVTEKSSLTCFWDRWSFDGVSSLDNSCPSNYEAEQFYIRRPK